MTLSCQQIKKHAAEGGVRCPYCGSSEIEGEEVVVYARLAEQRVGCLKCSKSWTDQYQLVTIVEESD